jgi:ubiquinone/menaquinone biosynthesis C-methylase UbiE
MSEIGWESLESAKRYDRNCDHQFRKGQALIDMMGIKKGDVVLDVGCGTGQLAVYVAGIIGPAGRLIGIDPSSHRIKIAHSKFPAGTVSRIRFMVGKAESLDAIPDNSVNHVYFCSSFHWVEDKKTALGEVCRVLVPGGTVGMTTLDRDSPRVMWSLVDPILAKYHIEKKPDLSRGIHRVSAAELKDLLSGAGFTSVSIAPRIILRNYGIPEEFLRQVEKRTGSLITDLPGDIREKIRQEILKEYEESLKYGIRGSTGVTLFARATKPV